MARPKLDVKVHSFSIKLRLREGSDDDLIAFFQSLPPRFRATALKMALRSGGIQLTNFENDFDDEDLEDSLEDMCF